MDLKYLFYNETMEEKWDTFVEHKSMNGTFLQTRKFINYHPEARFKDCSVCIFKGNELVAVVLACEIEDNNKKIFFAHKGTTFGGITISKSIYTASAIDQMMQGLLQFIKENGYEKIYVKMVPELYQRENTNLLDYFLYKYDFSCVNELNYYLKLEKYVGDIASQFSASKRRDYKYSLRNNLEFRLLEQKNEISDYYNVLLMNLKKLNLRPVHTLEDLYDLKYNRFSEKIEFWGVYYENRIIAGSMLFYFSNDIVHTQYLSSDESYLKMFPMDFLIYNLIDMAITKNKKIFTFGICTENQGKYLNLGLSRFKEGFGTEFCINRSYEKDLG